MDLYVVDGDHMLNLAQIAEKYINQGNWKSIHTDIIMDAVVKLQPGQMAQFSRHDFVVSGYNDDDDDSDSDTWEQQLDCPRTIQLVDDTITKLFMARVDARQNLQAIREQINQLEAIYSTLDKAYRFTQGTLQKHANEKGVIKV